MSRFPEHFQKLLANCFAVRPPLPTRGERIRARKHYASHSKALHRSTRMPIRGRRHDLKKCNALLGEMPAIKCAAKPAPDEMVNSGPSGGASFRIMNPEHFQNTPRNPLFYKGKMEPVTGFEPVI